MKLERYDNLMCAMIPAETGTFVMFDDVVALVEAIAGHIENHIGPIDDPAPWHKVVERDFDIAADIWSIFAKENGL